MTAEDEAPRHWLIPLAAEAEDYGDLLDVLDAEQRERAARIADPARRAAWVTAWARVRRHLGEHLGCRPEEVRLVRDAWGKPHVADSPLQFNLSHSGAWGLLALHPRQPVGVDVEYWRAGVDQVGVVRRCFTAAEREWWESLPVGERTPAFFQIWTCKEAFVKAVGRGIGLGLARCEFDLRGEPRLLAVPPYCGAPRDWRIRLLPVAEGYQAALALRV